MYYVTILNTQYNNYIHSSILFSGLVSIEHFHTCTQVISHFDQLTLPMPRGQFIGSSTSDLELSLSKYSAQHTLASSIATETYTRVDSLLKLLKTGSKVKEDLEQDTKVDILDFSDAVTYLETRVEGVRRDVGVAREMCERRERLWNLSIQFNQLEPDVDEVTMTYMQVHVTVMLR